MSVLFRNALIFDSEKRDFFHGWLDTERGVIARVGEGDGPDPGDFLRIVDLGGTQLIPGLIDVHTHGRSGQDFNYADREGMKKAARAYASHGITSLFPTLASAPFDSMLNSCGMIRELKERTGGAEFLGVHMEGRYLNPQKRGAHAVSMLAPLRPEELPAVVARAGLPLHITAALELDREGRFASVAAGYGATLGLGHTAASYAEAVAAKGKWNVSFTHLYNAMPPLHHRDGGPVLAAFNTHAYAELICDGLHIDPSVVAFTLRNTGLDRLVLISDSMAATDSADGEYSIAGNPAIVRNGIARTPDGALAGSTLSLDRAVENLARFCGISLREALLCATVNPAAETGVSADVGTLEPGKRADMLAVNLDDEEKKMNISRIFIGGEEFR